MRKNKFKNYISSILLTFLESFLISRNMRPNEGSPFKIEFNDEMTGVVRDLQNRGF